MSFNRLAVKNHVFRIVDPVSKYGKITTAFYLGSKRQVIVPENEMVYLLAFRKNRLVLCCPFRAQFEYLVAISFLGLVIFTFISCQPVVLAPGVAEEEGPARMEGTEKNLHETTFEHFLEGPVSSAALPEKISVPQTEPLAFKLYRQRLLVENDTYLLLEVTVGPDIVVPVQEMNFNATVAKTGQSPQGTGETPWYHVFVFVPEVENISEKKNLGSLGGKIVQERSERLLPGLVIFVIQAQMSVCYEIIQSHLSDSVWQDYAKNASYETVNGKTPEPELFEKTHHQAACKKP